MVEGKNYNFFVTLSATLSRGFPVRIPYWTPEAAPRDAALLEAILKRRGGKYINLDLALLWSEPLARGWNAHLGAVRREFAVSPRLKELAICTVASLTGADYEFTHHWPEYVKAGGRDDLRDRLNDPDRAASDRDFTDDERLAIRYAIEMTRNVEVPDALFEELRKRFDTTQIVELTAAIATYNMVARFLVALRVEDERKAKVL
jgi:alkylhydroperoxidase family enzyme